MNRLKKNWMRAAALMAVMTVLLSGCTAFDACAYMQAILDVSYKNETEDYMELTGATEEEANEIFQNNLDATMHEFHTADLSEELEDLMRIRDERDEERFRQFDEIIRSYQRDNQGKAEAAAARIPFFGKRRFRKHRPPQNA